MTHYTHSPDYKSWGKDCPPKPKKGQTRKGQRYIDVDGQLRPSAGAAPIFGDGICAQVTGVRALRESRQPNRITCQTRAGASPSIQGRITQKKQSSTRHIEHTIEYNWRLHGSHCHLINREMWTLSSTQTRPVSRDSETAQDACAKPGKTTRIAIQRAGTLKIRPGKSLRIQARALDKNGCPTQERISWTTNIGKIDRRGRLTLGKSTAQWVKVSAKAGAVKRRMRVRVDRSRKVDHIAPRGPRYDPSLSVQDEDRLPFFGLTLNAQSSPYIESQSLWRRSAIPMSLILSGTLCIVWAIRLRRRD